VVTGATPLSGGWLMGTFCFLKDIQNIWFQPLVSVLAKIQSSFAAYFSGLFLEFFSVSFGYNSAVSGA